MNTVLRLENAVLAIVALVAYHVSGFSWITFAIFILAPDLSMLGYLINAKVGAICYNIAHSWAVAGAIVLVAFWLKSDVGMMAGLILAAHIGIDRAIGYGLKHFSGFKDTHLGSIGQ
ncbi:MAG: DUF4260 domain-containing protein [Nitratireductor sp.]